MYKDVLECPYGRRGIRTRFFYPRREKLNAFVKPFLIDLPDTYDEIFQQIYKLSCSSKKCDEDSPKHPVICLLCGMFLCGQISKKPCCPTTNIHTTELWDHSDRCGGGEGVFLKVRESMVYLMKDGYPYKCGSPYLDSNGEQDDGLTRGRTLLLNRRRWRKICEIVASGQISTQVCRGRHFEGRPAMQGTL
eukprot:TRINITY_DN5084_c0_g1_i1.p1 TRINITY_DN5084_c0_g1~~TRINITY_DN5084_c0_g1_i1.p1  ORF type:complete len:191 (+),score=22.61 TRINITY_DN5084_c0_g1_i1:185-757(+)